MKDPGDPITLTLLEVQDPKNKDKIAHRSVRPNYDNTGKLEGYTYSGWQQGYIKSAASKSKHSKSN